MTNAIYETKGKARATLKRYRCDYYIKKDLAKEFVS